MMNKARITKHLNILNFILWLSLLINVICAPAGTDLRFACISSMALIVIDLFFEMLGNRDKRTRRKIVLEYVVHELESDDKQGED